MARNEKKKMLGFGLAAAGLFITALLVACAAMGGAGDAAAPDRRADIRGSDDGGLEAASAVTSSINYQGRLTDSGGNPLSGTYTMSFKLYETSTGGTALRTDTQSVTVTDGLFSTPINLGTSSFDGRALWLGIKVGSDPEMTPRQELRPVPYALSLRPGAGIIGSVSYGPMLYVRNTYAGPGYGDGIVAETLAPNSYSVWAIAAGNNSRGVYASTSGSGSYGVHAQTSANSSHGVFAYTSGVGSYGVYASTFGNYSPGVYAYTTGSNSEGIQAYTFGDGSGGFLTETHGKNAEGVYAHTYGNNSPAAYAHSEKDVGVYGKGREAGGYFTTTAAGEDFSHLKPGVNVSTGFDCNPGVKIETTGEFSDGVRAMVFGLESNGVIGFSFQDVGVEGETSDINGDYGLYTLDNIYVGGKIDLVGTVDPIIVEGFKADDKVTYAIGDVVCLDESGYVEPCSKADDTRVVGVVGPSVELEDGELTVVILGHQGAKPDEEQVKVLEERLARAEARKAELQGTAERAEETERIDNEITMLKSQLEEAKSITRQVVRVKADASYGAIAAGDLLTSSSTTGHVMKAQPVDVGGVEIYRPRTIIGLALEPLESGTGLIEVFVTLQ
jgi:hypothetical protein